MKTINNYIYERLILNKNKKEEDIEFKPFDSSYEGKMRVSKTSNIKLEFHKIYNSDYNLIAWTETWIEGIKDSTTTLIVQDEVYDYLLQFVSVYDSDLGFGIIEKNEQLFKQIHGIIPDCDILYVSSFENWFKTRELTCKKETPAVYGAFIIIAGKIENTLNK